MYNFRIIVRVGVAGPFVNRIKSLSVIMTHYFKSESYYLNHRQRTPG